MVALGARVAHVSAMLVMPTRHVTPAARRNLDRFRATSAACELQDDARRWTVIEWSWTESGPIRVNLRSDAGASVHFAMDASGVWQMRHDRLVA